MFPNSTRHIYILQYMIIYHTVYTFTAVNWEQKSLSWDKGVVLQDHLRTCLKRDHETCRLRGVHKDEANPALAWWVATMHMISMAGNFPMIPVPNMIAFPSCSPLNMLLTHLTPVPKTLYMCLCAYVYTPRIYLLFQLNCGVFRYRSLVLVIDIIWCDSKDCLITPIDTQVENRSSNRRDLVHCGC